MNINQKLQDIEPLLKTISLRYYKEINKDFIQDVNIKIVNALRAGKYNERQSFKGWVCTIARNTFLNEYKLRDRNNYLELQETPIAENESKEDYTYVFEKLKNVTNIDLLLLRYKGYSYKQIAAIKEIPIGSVKSNIHRARKELSKYTKEDILDL